MPTNTNTIMRRGLLIIAAAGIAVTALFTWIAADPSSAAGGLTLAAFYGGTAAAIYGGLWLALNARWLVWRATHRPTRRR